MKNRFRILAAALGLVAVALLSWPADAKLIRVCSPIGPTGVGAGSFVAKGSGTAYTRNSRGCMQISPVDLGDALASGYLVDPPVSQVFQALTTSSVTIPAAAYIDSITIQEDSGGSFAAGNAMKIGTTSGGTDIVSGAVVAANSIVTVPDVSMKLRAFSATAPQQIFFNGASYSTGPRYTVTIHWSYF